MTNCIRCGFKGWRKTGKIRNGLNIFRCGRCGKLATEERPFIRTPKKEMYLDIETSLTGIIGNFGTRVRGEWIDAEMIGHPYYIICWSALCTDKPNKVYSACVTQEDAMKFDDKNILATLWDLMNRADVIAGHNVDKFDVKKINTRFLVGGFDEPLPCKTIDTLKIAKKKYGFERNTMDYLCGIFGIKQKKKMERKDWVAIEKTGDPKSLRRMLIYNRGDVRSGAELLGILRGKELPDFGMTRLRGDPKDKRITERTQLDDIQDGLDYLEVSK
mgnify:CR=1 FL=1